MYIPQKKDIFKTGPGDPVYYHYLPLVGYTYKKRLINTLALFREKCGRLLEIGYGSGILFPELSHLVDEIYGLETHGQEELVCQLLKKENISNVILKPGSVLEMPFEDNFFDCIVSVSTFEHIAKFDKEYSLDKGFAQMKRVLRPAGRAILSFPVRNIITDSFFRLVGHSPRKIHPSSHADIIGTAEKYFKIEKMIKFPNFLPLSFSLYCSILCINNKN